MATEHVTVFMPLISEERMAEYEAESFDINEHASDEGIDISFEPEEPDDNKLYLIGPGEVFFVPADNTVQLPEGPEIVAPQDRNVLVVHLFRTAGWASILKTTGQPVPDWWAFEGVSDASFLTYVNSHELDILGPGRGFANGAAYRDAIMNGLASLNAFLLEGDAVSPASIDPSGNTVTVGVRTWANYSSTGITELNVLSALANFTQLAPSLEPHPLLAHIITDVSTSDVTIHVKFVYWKPSLINATSELDKGRPEPVPANSKISLQKRIAASNYTLIAEATTTDALGQVTLIAPRADLNAVNLGAGERLVFRVDVPTVPNPTQFEIQYQHDRPANLFAPRLKWDGIDDAWITTGRPNVDGVIENLDFLVDYNNNTFGTAEQPVSYYAGLPIFLQITYPVLSTTGIGAPAVFESEIRRAPKGLTVDVRSKINDTLVGFFQTDEHGQVWGMLAYWDEDFFDADLNSELEVVVRYKIEDESLSLPTIEGQVIEGGATLESYSSSRDLFNALEISNKLAASLGSPAGADGKARDLATVQVGSIDISSSGGVSEFSSTDGRHAGMIHALQQIRYMHQWFHHLTDGFKIGRDSYSWASLLGREEGATCTFGAHTLTRHYPAVIIHESFKTYDDSHGDSITNESLYGDVDIDRSDPNNIRWLLNLYGHVSFHMNDRFKITNNTTLHTTYKDVPSSEKVQFWRHFTIWHEFTHAVFNITINRLEDLDQHTALVIAKEPSTSGAINQPIDDGWSVLEEAYAAIPELALSGKMTGIEPVFTTPAGSANKYMEVYQVAPGGVVNVLLLNQGMTTGNVQDWRLGLRVPIAFSHGLWTALQELGGFRTLYDIFGGKPPEGNDLKDSVDYLRSATAANLFKYLVWGPLIGLEDPQPPPPPVPANPPRQWDDIDGSIAGFDVGDPEGKGAAGPEFGDANTRRIRINGPSTHRFMEVIQQEYWGRLGSIAGAQDLLRQLFGDIDDFPGGAALTDKSFYLWFDF